MWINRKVIPQIKISFNREVANYAVRHNVAIESHLLSHCSKTSNTDNAISKRAFLKLKGQNASNCPAGKFLFIWETLSLGHTDGEVSPKMFLILMQNLSLLQSRSIVLLFTRRCTHFLSMCSVVLRFLEWQWTAPRTLNFSTSPPQTSVGEAAAFTQC